MLLGRSFFVPDNAVCCWQAAINPLSATGRQLSHLLQYLHTSLGADVDVILNPEYDIKSMPLQAYYAFATPQQGVTAGLASTKALLLNVPGNKVLTLSLEVPEAWLVEVWPTWHLTPAHSFLTLDSYCCQCQLPGQLVLLQILKPTPSSPVP